MSSTSAPRRLPYVLVDVFTLPPARPYTGNPLAVVFDTEGLETSQLQTLAAEFNLSESAFPVAPTEEQKAQGVSYSTRIFTIAEEFPFAGHPSLGSCFAMMHRGVVPSGATSAVQHCKYGLVEMAISSPSAIALSSPIGFVYKKEVKSLSALAEEVIVADFNIASTPVSIHTASCGLPFVYIQVKFDEDVTNAKPSMKGCSMLTTNLYAMNKSDEKEIKAVGVVVFWIGEKGADGAVQVHQRVFTDEVPEDPATGSASIALGLVLHAVGVCAPGKTTVASISQGAEMGHASALKTKVIVGADGKCEKLWVEGEVVLIAEGTIRVPDI